jgi:beta-lactamase regulating signal transducer with metallopeptidase domain
MRFPLAAMFFVISGFIFLAFWGFSSLLITTVTDAISPLAADLNETGLDEIITLLPTAFGFICVLFFIVGIVLIFILDANADEPEMYWRR